MKLYLHKYTGDNRCINKWTVNPNSDSYKTVEVYNTTSLLAPQVVLDFDDSILSSGYNYAYINTYGRYYYITDMAADSGKKIILTLRVDPLNTFKSQILASPVNVIRSQSTGVTYIKDDSLPIAPDQYIKQNYYLDSAFTFASDKRFVVGIFGNRTLTP